MKVVECVLQPIYGIEKYPKKKEYEKIMYFFDGLKMKSMLQQLNVTSSESTYRGACYDPYTRYRSGKPRLSEPYIFDLSNDWISEYELFKKIIKIDYQHLAMDLFLHHFPIVVENTLVNMEVNLDGTI